MSATWLILIKVLFFNMQQQRQYTHTYYIFITSNEPKIKLFERCWSFIGCEYYESKCAIKVQHRRLDLRNCHRMLLLLLLICYFYSNEISSV